MRVDRKAPGLNGASLAWPALNSIVQILALMSGGLFGRVQAAVSTGESGRQEGGHFVFGNGALRFQDERIYH